VISGIAPKPSSSSAANLAASPLKAAGAGGAGPMLFELAGVGFAAAGRQILGPLDLNLSAGHIYALVGPNGSGKSTLLKLLARQATPTAGSISMLGSGISSYGDRAFARNIAYMPQFTPPAESMSVRELVALGRFPWHGAFGRFGDHDAAKVEEALSRADLRALSERMVDSLSGGERQRAWLAMMIAQDTHCLLLDEPTSALDIAHQVEMLSLLRQLGLERKLGVIIVMHDINMAARYCDTIIALRAGQVVAQGTPADILDGAVLQRIYDLPMGILRAAPTGMPISYVI